jgi:hypothetical protein
MTHARAGRIAGPLRLGAMALTLGAIVALAGCKGATPIRDILSNTTKYDQKTVRIAGKVVSSAGAFGYGVYQVDDGTGKITVVTKTGGAPVEGSRVGVEGTFHPAFTLGTDVVAVITESKRYSP